jgi:hypothetical protein
MVGSLDFERGFNMLRHAMPRLQQLDEWDEVLETFQKRHGELAKGVPDTLAECLRRETISQMRHYIDNPDHRFFLALLVNVQKRADICALIAERFPEQSATDTILGWADELIEVNDYGITLLDAAFPESLDIAIEEQSHFLILALKHALEGKSDSKTLTAELSEIHSALAVSCLSPLVS